MAGEAAIGVFVVLFFLVWILIFALIVGSIVFWIWMIVDCAKRKFINESEKLIWILVIVFTGLIGALVYWIAVMLNNPKGLMK